MTETRRQTFSPAITNGIDSIIASSNNIVNARIAQSNPQIVADQDASEGATGKPERGQNAASILASYRRSARQAEAQITIIPKRSTSISRPAKRKRHEDLVAFHRQSCQLFSSLDGALAQIRMSTSSSSSSSSSSMSSPLTSPTTQPVTRDTSLDCSSSPLLIGSSEAENASSRRSNVNPLVKRPTLQRMQCTIPPPSSPTNDAVDRGLTESNRSSPITPQSDISSCSSVSKTSQPGPRSHPPVTTTGSYCSSQVVLPRDCITALPRNPTSTTTIHWTSPETRRQQYAKIDAANSGFRLFLRRVFPQSMCRKVGGGRDGFWNDQTEDGLDDGKSVRRFRVSIDEIPVCEEPLSYETEDSDSEKRTHNVISEAEAKARILSLTEKHDGHQREDDKHFNEKTILDHDRATTGLSSFSASSSIWMLKRDQQQGIPRNTSTIRRLFSCCS